LAAAPCGLAETQHGIELMVLTTLVLFATTGFLEHIAKQYHVVKAISHPSGSGLTITASTARFLIIALNALGDIQVGDKAHIGLINAHTKSDGGHHHDGVFL